MFEFKHIKPFDRSYADNPGPMVSIVFPLQSVQVFKTIQDKKKKRKVKWL